MFIVAFKADRMNSIIEIYISVKQLPIKRR